MDVQDLGEMEALWLFWEGVGLRKGVMRDGGPQCILQP